MAHAKWTPDLKAEAAARICLAVMQGSNLRNACKGDDLPAMSTFLEWTLDDADIADQYARAREARAEARVSAIDDIVIEVQQGKLDPHAARVVIDAHKWQAGKENSKRYGDRLNIDGDVNIRLTDEQLNARVTHLLGKAGVIESPAREGAEEGPTKVVQLIPANGAAKA